MTEHTLVFTAVFAFQVENSSVDTSALDTLSTTGKVSNITGKGVGGLQHLYAEGTELTLTDVILFPCVASFMVCVY